MEMKKEDIKNIAFEVVNIIKENQKKMKKFKKGNQFVATLEHCSSGGSIVLGNQTFSTPYKGDKFTVLVKVDNTGQVYIIPYFPGFAFTVEQFDKISKMVNEVMKYAKELQENSEMLDLLDP
jgi:hypothetical protein